MCEAAWQAREGERHDQTALDSRSCASASTMTPSLTSTGATPIELKNKISKREQDGVI